MKFSIIVPVYNCEKYMSACIESVLSQSYGDFELILVNDGSSDNSASICKVYSEEHERVILIDKENAGPASARNAGLDASTGDYVLFLDSDDRMCDGLLESLCEKITEKKKDIYFGTYINSHIDEQDRNNERRGDGGSDQCIENACDEIEPFHFDEKIIESGNSIEIIHNLLLGNETFGAVWRNAFSKEALTKYNLRFDEDYVFVEDADFLYRAVLDCKSFGIANIPFVKYSYMRGGSLSRGMEFLPVKSSLLFSSKWFSYFFGCHGETKDEQGNDTANDKSLEIARELATTFSRAMVYAGKLSRAEKAALKPIIKENDWIMGHVSAPRWRFFALMYRMFGLNCASMMYRLKRRGSVAQY